MVPGLAERRSWKPGDHTRAIFELRIIHNKGTGALARSVHALLSRSPLVESFRTAATGAGGWGATLVDLKRK